MMPGYHGHPHHSPQRRGGDGPPMAYMPPGYEQQGDGARVEQRHNPDGSMSISVQPSGKDGELLDAAAEGSKHMDDEAKESIDV